MFERAPEDIIKKQNAGARRDLIRVTTLKRTAETTTYRMLLAIFPIRHRNES